MRILTDDERQARIKRRNEYLRRYRAAHPDKVKTWRENYALNVAERIKARREGGERGADE